MPRMKARGTRVRLPPPPPFALKANTSVYGRLTYGGPVPLLRPSLVAAVQLGMTQYLSMTLSAESMSKDANIASDSLNLSHLSPGLRHYKCALIAMYCNKLLTLLFGH